jgi:predicted dehydrogenase
MRGGLIGCGNVSRHHLRGWTRVPGASIEALCEIDHARLEAAGTKLPTARLYQSAEAMLAAEKLDFVEVCTGPESHAEIVRLAAEHGAHVLCQKPAALVRADLVGMIECCDAANVRLMIHENWRHRPWYRSFRTELDSGTIGKPLRIRISHRDTRALRSVGFADQPFLVRRPQLILMEMGCHLIDTARFLLGEIATVFAQLLRAAEGHAGEDIATLSVVFVSGALGLLDMSWCAQPDVARPEWALNETVVEGTCGAIKLQTDGSLLHVGLAGSTRRIEVPLPPEDEVYVQAYSATQRIFIEGCLCGIPHETSGLDTLKTMDVVWAGYHSAERGRAEAIEFT